MTVASLGFAVDSSSATGAAVDLDKLTASAGRAERGARGVGRASKEMSASMQAMTSILRDIERNTSAMAAGFARGGAAASALDAATGQMGRSMTAAGTASAQLVTHVDRVVMSERQATAAAAEMERAVEASATAHARSTAAITANSAALQANASAARLAQFQTRNLQFQLFDVAQTAAMGMNPLMILMQQGPQIAQIYGPEEGGVARAFRETGTMLTRMVVRAGPAVAVIGTLGLGVAALRSEINETKGASVSMSDTALAAFQMLGSGMVTAFGPAIDGTKSAFSSLWNDTGDLSRDVFNAMARDGARFAASTRREVDIVAAYWKAGVGTITTAWELLPGALGDVTMQAVRSVLDGIQKMIDGAIQGLNWVIERLPEFVGASKIDPVSIGSPDNPWSGRAKALKDAMAGIGTDIAAAENAANAAYAKRISAIDGQDYFGQLRSRAMANDLANDKPEKATKGSRTAVDKAAREAARLAEAYRGLVANGREFVASQELERSLLGMNETAANRLRYEFELMNDARRIGINLSPEQSAELRALASDMAAAEGATSAARDAMQRMQEQVQFEREVIGGFFSDMQSGLRNGGKAWDVFANAATRAIDRVSSKLEDELLDSILKVNKAGAGGGGGSIAGGILSSLGSFLGFGGPTVLGVGGAASASAGTFIPAGAGGGSSFGFSGFYANGTDNAAPGWAVVGERGKELVHFGGGERVIPNHKLPSRNGSGSQPAEQRDTVVRVEINGATGNNEVRSLVEQGVREGITRARPGLIRDSYQYTAHQAREYRFP